MPLACLSASRVWNFLVEFSSMASAVIGNTLLMRVIAAAVVMVGCCGRLAAGRSHGCDKNCVCDGVDLSSLAGQMYSMAEAPQPHPEGALPKQQWEYRISVCAPLPRDKIPTNCATGIGHPWHPPHVVRYERPDGKNESRPTGHCQRVGSDVVLAQATRHNHNPVTHKNDAQGVQLVFTGEDGGKTHTVTANLICNPQAGGGNVRSP